jgi:hypothetical protein
MLTLRVFPAAHTQLKQARDVLRRAWAPLLRVHSLVCFACVRAVWRRCAVTLTVAACVRGCVRWGHKRRGGSRSGAHAFAAAGVPCPRVILYHL